MDAFIKYASSITNYKISVESLRVKFYIVINNIKRYLFIIKYL